MTKSGSGKPKTGVMPRTVRSVRRTEASPGIRLPKPTKGTKCADFLCALCKRPIPPARRAILSDCIDGECTGNCRSLPAPERLCVDCKSKQEESDRQRAQRESRRMPRPFSGEDD